MNPQDTKAFSSLFAMQEEHHRLRAAQRERAEEDAFLDEVEAFIERGRETGTILDTETGQSAAQALLDYWASFLYRAGRTPPEALLAHFDPERQPLLDNAVCPYVGLGPFQGKDAVEFFGRAQVIGFIIERLREKHVILVVGPSGSGASSLTLAGLLPLLQDGAIPGSAEWDYLPPIQPGASPLTRLAPLLMAPEDTVTPELLAQHMAAFRQDPGYLRKTLAARGLAAPVIVVDEFDQVFTLCDKPEDARAFIANLEHFAATEPTQNTLILVIHNGFEENLKHYPTLWGWFQEHRCRVPPPTARELREAILKPAERVGLKFDEQVVTTLVEDILGEPSALALLQFTLLELWEHRYRNRITWDTYQKIGGGRRLLARIAREFYQGLPRHDREICKYLLLRMIEVGEAVIRPGTQSVIYRPPSTKRVRREILLDSPYDKARVEAVLDGLIDARLLNVTGPRGQPESEVQIAHEALLQSWDRLSTWVIEEQHLLHVRQRFDNRVATWKTQGRSNDYLLDAAQIAEAREWIDSRDAKRLGYDPELPDLIESSEAAIEAKQRKEIEQARALAEERRHGRNLFAATTAIALLCAGIAIYVYLQADKLNRAFEIATNSAKGRIVLTLNLIDDSISAHEQKRAERSKASLASARRMLEPMPEKLSKIRTYLKQGDLQAVLDQFSQPAAVPATVQDARQEPVLEQVITSKAGQLWGVSFDPWGRLVATAGNDGKAQIWDARDGSERYPPLDADPDLLNDVAFNSDASLLATGGQHGLVRLWKLSKQRAPALQCELKGPGRIYDVSFSPGTGRFLAAGFDGKQALVWDLWQACPGLADKGSTVTIERGSTLLRVNHDDAIYGVGFSPDCRQLATAGADGVVRLWEFAELLPGGDGKPLCAANPAQTGAEWGKEHARFSLQHGGPVFYADYSPDGSLLVTSGMDSNIRVWEPSSGNQIGEWEGHEGLLGRIRFNPNGEGVIASAGSDRLVKLWKWDEKTKKAHLLFTLEGAEGPVFGLDFTRDGKYLVSSSFDGSARIWSLKE